MQNYYSPFLPNYSDFFLQRRNQYENKDAYRQNSYSSPYYPMQSYLQTNNYPWNVFSQYERYNAGLIQPSPIDSRYQYQYHWPYHNQIHEPCPRRLYNKTSLSTYSRLFYSNDYENQIYQYNKKSFSHRRRTKKDAKISIPSGRSHIEEYPAVPRFPCAPPNIPNYSHISSLPPKIRIIFIPSSASLPQQSCNLAPCIPPFLFNRISQPQCSLPLPPPLPQLSSLPLSPAVQQMVMQQYSNPVAVFPSNDNEMPLGTNVCQPSNNSFPSTCRACVPEPPPLAVPVTDHCWIQHCSACHHVPADASIPNERLHNHGRMTPLLRQPTVTQYIHDEENQQHYPHINSQARRNSWSNNLPPLPPGAVIISDEYITEDQPYETHNSSNSYAQHSQHRSNQNCASGFRDSYTDSSYSSKSSVTSCSTSSLSSYPKILAKTKYNRGSTTTMDSLIHQRNAVHTSRWDAHNNLTSQWTSQNGQAHQLLPNYDLSSKRKERDNGQIKLRIELSDQNRTHSKVSASFLNTKDSQDVFPTRVSNQRVPDAISVTTITTEDNTY